MPRIPIAVTDLARTKDPAYVVPTLTDGDGPTNDHDWLMSAGDIVTVFNSGVGALNATLIGTPDAQGRSDDSSQSIAAGTLGVFGPLKTLGWIQTDGKCHIDTDDSSGDLKFSVLRGAS